VRIVREIAHKLEGNHMNASKKAYKPPTLITYGPIGDHTFTTPGGNVKGCIPPACHLDSFSENSALSGS
jgi:hypothetical protein